LNAHHEKELSVLLFRNFGGFEDPGGLIDSDEFENSRKSRGLITPSGDNPGNVMGKLDQATIDACKLGAIREAREETMNLFHFEKHHLQESHAVLHKSYLCFNVLIDHVNDDKADEMTANQNANPQSFDAFVKMDEVDPEKLGLPHQKSKTKGKRSSRRLGKLTSDDFDFNRSILKKNHLTPGCWLEMSEMQRFFLSDLIKAKALDPNGMKSSKNLYLECKNGDGEEVIIWARAARVIQLAINLHVIDSLPKVTLRKELQTQPGFTCGTFSLIPIE